MLSLEFLRSVMLFGLAERQALELILSQNIIKLQTTDNQV